MFPDPLRAFQLVVRSGSIRKASELLSVAPSSVSRQVAILERMIGTALFNREAKGLVLTSAGQMVADYSNMVISGFDALRLDLSDLRGSSRHVTVATVESIASVGPANAISKFRATFPNTTFSFTILRAPEVVEAVHNQSCDIGISYNTTLDQAITCFARIDEPIVAAMPVDHPLATCTSLRLQDLVDHPVALPDRIYGVRRMVERICIDHDIMIRPVLQATGFEVLRDFARSGAGIAILPLRAALLESDAGRVRIVPFRHRSFMEGKLDILLLKQTRIPRITRLFCETLREELSLPDELVARARASEDDDQRGSSQTQAGAATD